MTCVEVQKATIQQWKGSSLFEFSMEVTSLFKPFQLAFAKENEKITEDFKIFC
jgi:hypothetical protein